MIIFQFQISNMKKIFSSILLLSALSLGFAQENLIPKPQKITINKGELQLTPDLGINFGNAKEEGEFLITQLKQITEKDFKSSKNGKINS